MESKIRRASGPKACGIPSLRCCCFSPIAMTIRVLPRGTWPRILPRQSVPSNSLNLQKHMIWFCIGFTISRGWHRLTFLDLCDVMRAFSLDRGNARAILTLQQSMRFQCPMTSSFFMRTFSLPVESDFGTSVRHALW